MGSPHLWKSGDAVEVNQNTALNAQCRASALVSSIDMTTHIYLQVYLNGSSLIYTSRWMGSSCLHVFCIQSVSCGR